MSPNAGGHEEYLELAELYALGGLEADERARFEEHVADGCAECQQVVRASLDVAAQLLLAVAPVAPTPAVRERLFARIASESASSLGARARPPRRGARTWRPRFAAAASVLLLVGISAFAAVLGERLVRERGARADLEEALEYTEAISWSLVRELETEKAQRAELTRRLESHARIVAAIGAPLVRSLELAGQGDYVRAVAKAYIEPESGRLILYAHNLPPVPDGRTYQLWVIVEDRPTSAGLFRSDSWGEAKYDTGRIPALEGPVTVAVTLEPEGGVERPTGPIVLAGS